MTRGVAQCWGMQRAVWMGIRDPHAIALCIPMKQGASGAPRWPQSPVREMSLGLSITLRDARLHPLDHLVLDPPHAAWAKLNPFGKLACRFKAVDVLRRVEHEVAHLPFR